MAILVKLRNKMRNNPYMWDICSISISPPGKIKNTEQLDITLELKMLRTRHLLLLVKSNNRTDLWLQKHPEGDSARHVAANVSVS